jgi:hypothetical protein
VLLVLKVLVLRLSLTAMCVLVSCLTQTQPRWTPTLRVTQERKKLRVLLLVLAKKEQERRAPHGADPGWTWGASACA